MKYPPITFSDIYVGAELLCIKGADSVTEWHPNDTINNRLPVSGTICVISYLGFPTSREINSSYIVWINHILFTIDILNGNGVEPNYKFVHSKYVSEKDLFYFKMCGRLPE